MKNERQQNPNGISQNDSSTPEENQPSKQKELTDSDILLGRVLLGIGVIGTVCMVLVLVHYYSLDTLVDRYYFRQAWDHLYLLLLLPVFSTFFASLYLKHRRAEFFMSIGSFLLSNIMFVFMAPLFVIFSFILTAILILLLFGNYIPSLITVVLILLTALFLMISAPHNDYNHAVRSKVSRTKSDMRSIATAIESYMVDLDTYPPWTMDKDKQAFFDLDILLPSFMSFTTGGPMTLTTPVAFFSSYPKDPFSHIGKERTFAYWAPFDMGWILWSPGPDFVFDLDFMAVQSVYKPFGTNPTLELLVQYTYDSSNGSISAGDIWCVMGTGVY